MSLYIPTVTMTSLMRIVRSLCRFVLLSQVQSVWLGHVIQMKEDTPATKDFDAGISGHRQRI